MSSLRKGASLTRPQAYADDVPGDCFHSDLRTLECALANGADPDAVHLETEASALTSAVGVSRSQLIGALLEAGADAT